MPKAYYWKPPPGYPKPEQLHKITIPPGEIGLHAVHGLFDPRFCLLVCTEIKIEI